MPNAVVEDLQTPSAMNPTQDPLSPEIPVVEHPSGINAVSALNPMQDPFYPEITVEQDLQISSALDSMQDPFSPEIPVIKDLPDIQISSALDPMQDPCSPEIPVIKDHPDIQISSALDSGVRDPCNSSPAVENSHKQNSVVEEDPWIKQVLYWIWSLFGQKGEALK